MTAIAITLAICITLALGLIALARKAPRGWQDKNGFHYGSPPVDRST